MCILDSLEKNPIFTVRKLNNDFIFNFRFSGWDTNSHKWKQQNQDDAKYKDDQKNKVNHNE